MPKKTKQAPSFAEWYVSADNPLCDSSDAVIYFTKGALRRAFDAGVAHAKTEDADLEENVFT